MGGKQAAHRAAQESSARGPPRPWPRIDLAPRNLTGRTRALNNLAGAQGETAMALGSDIDQGTGYGRKPGTINRDLTETGPGTKESCCGAIGIRSRLPAKRPIDAEAKSVSWARISSSFGMAKAKSVCFIHAARIVAPRFITARSRSAASAAATTAGSSGCRKAGASSSLCEPELGMHRDTCASSPGIRPSNATA